MTDEKFDEVVIDYDLAMSAFRARLQFLRQTVPNYAVSRLTSPDKELIELARVVMDKKSKYLEACAELYK